MPWQPLPRIAFAVAIYPFAPTSPADLPLELGDELYIIEQGGRDGQWLRGYLVAPPSLLAGLTSGKGRTLEARVFSGIFPRSCVEVREVLGEDGTEDAGPDAHSSIPPRTAMPPGKRFSTARRRTYMRASASPGLGQSLGITTARDPDAPRPPAPVPMLKIGDETPTSLSEPLVDEIGSCLREWHSRNLHDLLLGRKYLALDKMASLVRRLDLTRKQLLHDVLTNHELQSLREQTVWDLVRGNKLLEGEIIVRDPTAKGRILAGDDSIIEATKLQAIMSLLDGPLPAPVHDTATLHHLLLDVRSYAGSALETTSLEFFLAAKAPGAKGEALSESYTIIAPTGGSLVDAARMLQMKTLFTDLGSADMGFPPAIETDIYLIVKIRSQQHIHAAKPGSRGRVVSGEEDSSLRGDKSKPPAVNANSWGGRRSLMWAQKNQRSLKGRHGSVAESNKEESQERPSTAGSKDTAKNETRSSSQIGQTVVRLTGIGAVKLNAMARTGAEFEEAFTIWTPSPSMAIGVTDMPGIISDLISSKPQAFERSRRGERLLVSLRHFEHANAEDLIRATPTVLSDITQTSKMGFSGAPTRPRSDIYITIDEAFLPKHCMLSRASGGASPLPPGLTGSNLQVSLEVRRTSTGERIENCIFAASNTEPSSTWESMAGERGTAWSQTIRLDLDPAVVPGAHIVMVLSDSPGPPFATCYMPLWEAGAFMRDGPQSLLLYKYDDSTSAPRSTMAGKGGYLAAPWNARGKDDVAKDESVTGPVATLRLRSFLCSTYFSQDKTLLGLRRWRDQTPRDLQEILQRLHFVPESELVKLLHGILDDLFAILVEQAGNDEFEDLVFKALVVVLGTIYDRRYHVQPLVDLYVDKQFNYPFAAPCLIRSFTRLLGNATESEASRKLRTTLKVVRYIIKFITHARDQQKAKEVGIGITSSSPGFTRHLGAVFKSLNELMQDATPSLVGSQTLIVQHFHTWLPELSNLLPVEEIAQLAFDFVTACEHVKGKLILYKLVLIINLSRLDVFTRPDQRALLVSKTAPWIQPHWGKTDDADAQYKEQVRLCCSIVATQLDSLGTEAAHHLPQLIDSYHILSATERPQTSTFSLLFPTSYPFATKALLSPVPVDEAVVELSAVLAAISMSPSGLQLDMATPHLHSLLEDVLRKHLGILQCNAFPSSWLSVHIYHHKSTMRALQYLASILMKQFLPDPEDAESYNTELWKHFFTTLLRLVASDALALETFPEQKRRAVWKIAGDVREHGAELLRETWAAIGWETDPEERQRYGLTRMGGYQVQYVPTLVGPIIELCLSVHQGLRRVAVEILQAMLVSEWTLSEDLSVIQTEMIDCLDRFFKSRHPVESIPQKAFINELLDLFEPLSRVEGEPLYDAVKDMISSVEEFLDLLTAVHCSDGAGEVNSMVNRLHLMEYLRDMQKEDIFIRYVHQLAELQVEAKNHTEAGLALRLHADLYTWDMTRMMPALPDPEFPAQSHFDRKEKLYFEIIDHYENGDAWRLAVETYEELQEQYRENTFDLAKLARTQRAIATINDKIVKNDRSPVKYYKVTYRGMGFPVGLRDKDFIFEGSASERSTGFTDRLQEQHPSAQIVISGEVTDVEGQFLHISQVTPHRDLHHPVYQRSRIPQSVRDHLIAASPKIFSVTSKRNTAGPVSQHSAEKILYTTADVFPTILKRSEIVEIQTLQLSTLEIALERTLRKTQEMLAVERRIFHDNEDAMAPLLIEALNVSADSMADASVSKYRELLPTPRVEDGEVQELQLQPLETALKVALIDHAILVKRCLASFQKSPSVFVTSQGQLEEIAANFETTYAPELAALSVPQPRRELPRAASGTSWSSPPRLSSAAPENSRDTKPTTFSTIQHVSTTGTIDTSILNMSAQQESNASPSRQNPSPQADRLRQDSKPTSNGIVPPKRGDSIPNDMPPPPKATSRSRDVKETLANSLKRLSMLSTHSTTTTTTTHTTHARNANHTDVEDTDGEDNDKEWVTQSDLSQAYRGGHSTHHRNRSRTGTMTTTASATVSHGSRSLRGKNSVTVTSGGDFEHHAAPSIPARHANNHVARHALSEATSDATLNQRNSPAYFDGHASMTRGENGSAAAPVAGGSGAGAGGLTKVKGSVRRRISQGIMNGLGAKASKGRLKQKGGGAGTGSGGMNIVEE